MSATTHIRKPGSLELPLPAARPSSAAPANVLRPPSVLTVDPIALAVELVRIPSPTGREAAVCEFVSERLTELGWSVRRQPVGEGGRFNIYATRGAPVVVLTTHLDTVLPELPVEVDEEWLRGRGSVDAKGIAAAQIAAAERLVAGGEERVALLFVVGEEGPSDGARAAAALEPKGRFLVNGEPTENHLAVGTKGSIRMTLLARGRPAHSAYPEEGDSAIERMLDLLGKLRSLDFPSDETLGATTMNIGTITGGTAPNIIPDRCQVELMFRTVGPTDDIEHAIMASTEGEVEVDVTLRLPPVHLSTREGFPVTLVRFATDLPFLEPWGERFLLGPGTIRVAHTEHERIGKGELLDAVECYERLVRLLIAEVDA